jgi:hypothetical protein
MLTMLNVRAVGVARDNADKILGMLRQYQPQVSLHLY